MKKLSGIAVTLIVALAVFLPAKAQQTTPSLLTPSDHVLVLVDHESQAAFPVANIPVESLRNNVALVAGGAKIFNVPVLVTTGNKKSFSGPVFPEVAEFYPANKVRYIDRATKNARGDADVYEAITGFGKKKLVIAGLCTSVSIVRSVLSAIAEGYEVYVIADACGDINREAYEMAIRRMIQFGAVPVTSTQYVLELQRDRARGETYAAVTALFKKYGGAYGLGIRYAHEMLKH